MKLGKLCSRIKGGPVSCGGRFHVGICNNDLEVEVDSNIFKNSWEKYPFCVFFCAFPPIFSPIYSVTIL